MQAGRLIMAGQITQPGHGYGCRSVVLHQLPRYPALLVRRCTVSWHRPRLPIGIKHAEFFEGVRPAAPAHTHSFSQPAFRHRAIPARVRYNQTTSCHGRAARRQNGAIPTAVQRNPPRPAPPPHPAGCRSAGPDETPLPAVRASMERMALKRWRTIISVAANRPASSGKNTQSDICKLLRQSASTRARFSAATTTTAHAIGQHDNFPALAHPDADVQRQGRFPAAVVRQSDPGVPPWSATGRRRMRNSGAVIAIDLQATFAQQNPVGKNNCGMSQATRQLPPTIVRLQLYGMRPRDKTRSITDHNLALP